MRGRILVGLLLACAAPAHAQRLGVGLGIGLGGSAGGGTSGPPTIANLAGGVAGDAATGTAIVTPVASGLTGCTWSIAAQANFAQASGTGGVTKAAASVTAGSYAPVTTCSLTTNGQTASISAALAITVTAPAVVPGTLDFSDPANSGLTVLL